MDFIEGKDEAVLFGLAQAIPHIWRTRSVFLVEGAFDLFPIQRHVPQVVATLTARVVDALVRVLRRLVRRIWLGYDMDETGRRGSDRFIKAHGDDFEDVSIIEYPKVKMISGKLIKDPGDLWEAWGDTQLGAFLTKATVPDPQLESFYAEALSPR
jgi:DNA primase